MDAESPHKRPTLKTIAEISGLAVQTVSRALGDAPDISAKTKVRVREIADQVGYVPDRAGVRLRTGRTNVISLVISTEHDVMSLTSRLISSIAGGLRDTPYHLVVTPDFPDEDPLKAIQYIVRNRAADAVIINRIQPEDPRVKYLMEEDFPFVTHGRTVWADQHAYVDFDNRLFGRRAIDELARKKRRKIVIIAPPLDQTYAQDIIAGASEAAAERGISLVQLPNVTSDSHRDDVRAQVKDCITRDPAIDGLISASPNATMAAIVGVEDVGWTIGEEIDIFSKETTPILDLFRPNILTAREHVEKAGKLLAQAAFKAAKRSAGPPIQFLDEG